MNTVRSFWPETFLEWVQLLSYIISAVGILIAAISYRANKKVKRAEWLKSLFEKFYENNFYKDVRKWLDFDLLGEELKNDSNFDKEEKLADFLNFFEFIATLKIAAQIDLVEIQRMFGYYLYKVKKSELCINYIKEFKYKNLAALLSEIK